MKEEILLKVYWYEEQGHVVYDVDALREDLEVEMGLLEAHNERVQALLAD
jgi:hypothetical protein